MFRFVLIFAVLFGATLPLTAHAQADEIVVTASRIASDNSRDTFLAAPGIFYERRGDFLLISLSSRGTRPFSMYSTTVTSVAIEL